MTSQQKYRQLCEEEESIPLFSKDWWLDTVCGASKWDVVLAESDKKILAALPYYQPVPHVISMPSYTQTMGVWFAPEVNDMKYTTLLGRRQGICADLIENLPPYTSFLQQFPYTFTDWLPFYWTDFRQTTRYTYVLHAIANQELLWENMASNIRRNITKAVEKNGIVVQSGIPVDDFLQVFKATFQRQQKPVPQDIDVLRRLIDVCRKRNQGDIWGGYDEAGRLHAAVFVVWQKSAAYYIAGGGNPALRDSGAHSAAMWEAIRFVSQHTNTFDFEGSMIPGVERFFREFGAKQMPFFTITRGDLSLFNRIRIKLSGSPK